MLVERLVSMILMEYYLNWNITLTEHLVARVEIMKSRTKSCKKLKPAQHHGNPVTVDVI